MTQLIDPTDSRYFTCTSDLLYDKHNYKVVNNNNDYVIVESWEEAALIWWNTPPKFISHIEVIDS
ncbi:hypothetical protein S820908_043 [Synechococcus phage S-CAM9]|uniref:DUF7441 domain-containing protein n=1 Tax=Synechococcus phage S-CAM9 TaxID=1883369 RepID=A0A1D8KNG2_9CAUD|nr:hypothetical protein BOW85_gp206 [Synechococcus phage S-CAM9]AOV60190.1 hypothetical protein S050808_043 [Synechococcus phage S-CAM9]AOV60418.1 hypothetical protein S820908_043 [Synechococcus phage S-CAM9]AOV60646.1 hypothetical protein N161109_043 [Synechococcus phage S-CAM9]